MTGTRFQAVSSSQQTTTKALKAIRKEAPSRAFDSLYEPYMMPKREGKILSESIMTIFISFTWISMVPYRNLIVILCIVENY